jgi:hypothetical protein
LSGRPTLIMISLHFLSSYRLARVAALSNLAISVDAAKHRVFTGKLRPFCQNTPIEPPEHYIYTLVDKFCEVVRQMFLLSRGLPQMFLLCGGLPSFEPFKQYRSELTFRNVVYYCFVENIFFWKYKLQKISEQFRVHSIFWSEDFGCENFTKISSYLVNCCRYSPKSDFSWILWV